MSTSKRPKRPADFNQRAYQVFQEAIGEKPSEPEPGQVEERPEAPATPEREKDPAAVSLGRRGGLKGGPARAAKLSKEERSEIGKKAAKARWDRTET
jgi:hypothetical protein